jgi:hypothetical protein
MEYIGIKKDFRIGEGGGVFRTMVRECLLEIPLYALWISNGNNLSSNHIYKTPGSYSLETGASANNQAYVDELFKRILIETDGSLITTIKVIQITKSNSGNEKIHIYFDTKLNRFSIPARHRLAARLGCAVVPIDSTNPPEFDELMTGGSETLGNALVNGKLLWDGTAAVDNKWGFRGDASDGQSGGLERYTWINTHLKFTTKPNIKKFSLASIFQLGFNVDAVDQPNLPSTFINKPNWAPANPFFKPGVYKTGVPNNHSINIGAYGNGWVNLFEYSGGYPSSWNSGTAPPTDTWRYLIISKNDKGILFPAWWADASVLLTGPNKIWGNYSASSISSSTDESEISSIYTWKLSAYAKTNNWALERKVRSSKKVIGLFRRVSDAHTWGHVGHVNWDDAGANQDKYKMPNLIINYQMCKADGSDIPSYQVNTDYYIKAVHIYNADKHILTIKTKEESDVKYLHKVNGETLNGTYQSDDFWHNLSWNPDFIDPSLPTAAEAAETTAIASGISTTNVTGVKTLAFGGGITNGKATATGDSIVKLKAIFDEVGITTLQKRTRRRAALKLMFLQTTAANVTRMVIPKANLGLPETFKKANAVVVKAGETFDISTGLGADEGFYSVLDNGEAVSMKTPNVTATFTRADDGANERYNVSLGSGETFGSIVINADSANNFNANGTGYLVPGDILDIDGRNFFIGSVGDGGASGSVSDPYVYSINSSIPVKLPNKHAFYRMFEQGNNYINVEVDQATQEHQVRMLKYAEMVTPVTHNIVCDGYFYHKAFISAEGHTLSVDYANKKVSCSDEALEFFTIKKSKKKFSCGEFGDECKCMTIAWKTKEGKKIHTEIMFFPNPHIENGINVIPETTKKSTGLIVTNYKPKLMVIPSISTEKYGKLWKRLKGAKDKFQQKSIKGKNEKWHKH